MVFKLFKFYKFLYKCLDILIVCVEDMGVIFMEKDVSLIVLFGVIIFGNVVFLIYYIYWLFSFGKVVC